jgi:hypothetical protein
MLSRYTFVESPHKLPGGITATLLTGYSTSGSVGYQSLKLRRVEGQDMLQVVSAFEHTIDTAQPECFKSGRYASSPLGPVVSDCASALTAGDSSSRRTENAQDNP